MSISGISTNSPYQASFTNFYQMKQDFKSLSKALQSGDLSTANQAFAQLQKDTGMSTDQTQSSSSSVNSNSTSDLLQTLGNALQNGDLSGAQKAFSQIQQNMQAHRHHHHHHHGGGTGVAQSDSTSQAAISTDVGSSVNVQA